MSDMVSEDFDVRTLHPSFLQFCEEEGVSLMDPDDWYNWYKFWKCGYKAALTDVQNKKGEQE